MAKEGRTDRQVNGWRERSFTGVGIDSRQAKGMQVDSRQIHGLEIDSRDIKKRLGELFVPQ